MVSTGDRSAPFQPALLAAIFILAAAWMVFNAATLPIWYDETITLLELAGNAAPIWVEGILPAAEHREAFTGLSGYGELLDALYHTDVHPPLYYIVALTWTKLFGVDLFALRVLSSLFVLGAGLLLARAAAPRGRLTQAITLFVFFAAPMTLWAAVNARDYGLALLLIAAGILTSARELEKDDEAAGGRGSLRLISLTGLFGGLAFLTHYLSLLAFGPLFAVLALRRLRRAPLAVCAGSALYALGGALAAPMLLKHLGARPDAFSGFEDLGTEVAALAVILFGAMSEPAQELWISLTQFLVFLALLSAGTVFAVLAWRRAPADSAQAAGLYGFCVGLFVLFLVSDKSLAKAHGLDRYCVLMLPFLALVIGRVPGELRQGSKVLGNAAAALIVLLAAVTWWDGVLRKAQWTNGMRFSAVAQALPEVGAERSIAVVPKGFGRGMPGTWAYELPPEMPMLVLFGKGELEALKSRIEDYDLFAFGDDLSGISLAKVADFKAELEARGFTSDDGVVYRRIAGDAGS